jgi:transposase-like protein
MAQHFLLTAKSRTISELEVARMSEEEARVTFEKLRWDSTDGKPVCSNCGCTESYTINTTSKTGKSIRRYKCKACRKQYTVTSGTLFANYKLELRDYLMAIIVFTNAVKGISASQMSRALGVQYKTAFVLVHKLRASLMDNQSNRKLSGTVEMDGCYVGKTRPENKKEDRLDLRLSANANPNKRCVLVARQRDTDGVGANKTVTCISKGESTLAIDTFAKNNIELNSTIHSDGAIGYDNLEAWYNSIKGDHSIAYVGENGECSNQAESFFSRFRRLQYGQCHKLGNLYLSNYVNEVAYREDNRRVSNKTMMLDIAKKSINTPTHSEWTGYWQGNKRTSERLVA